ncbi:arginine--tRNA ligase [bacterium BMS3Abin02]|nr:arginine--tRNA ligase [bacterium BMS3Abin02]GBE22226.1 arginine--tRNA ligase [bacterium BMS3Bbin01]
MSLLARLSETVGDAFEAAGVDRSYGTVVVSKRPDLGQFQCTGALAAARSVGRNPREIAQTVINALTATEMFAAVSIAGPGFINLTLTDAAITAVTQAAVDDERCGCTLVERPVRYIVDFGGPTVAKAMHVGHLRSTIIGDSLQRLLRFLGHDVTSDIHMGDWGTQMGMLIIEVERRYPDLPYFDASFSGPYPTESPVTLDDLHEMYPTVAARVAEDEAEAERARRATTELQNGRPGYRALWQHFANVSISAQRADFEALGVKFDLWYGESTVHDRIAPLLERIKSSGRAVISDGALVVPVAEEGDQMDIPPMLLTKSDGSYLYTTTDLATLDQRITELKAEDILYVVDARQALHFIQVFRAARLTGIVPDDVALEHIAFGTMNGTNGKPFKTREGGVLKLKDLIAMVTDAALARLAEARIAESYPDEERAAIAKAVGLAALKFGDLSNHRTSNYVFDLDRFSSFEGKTGPYLLYGAVRIRSILRKAAEHAFLPGPITDPATDVERDLMLFLARLPDSLARAAELRAPNHIAEFAYDLTTRFNRFYEQCHILSEQDPKRRGSWLSLVAVTLRELILTLDLLGISVPERM